jgi:hypothetical protein
MGRRILLAVALAIAVVGCGPTNTPDYDQLRADPAFAIQMPGAEAIGEGGARRVYTFEGQQPAFVWRTYGSDANASEVYAYYTREVERLGWIYTGSNGRATTELDVRFWHKLYGFIRIAIQDQRKLGPGSGSYPTRFDVSIVGNR